MTSFIFGAEGLPKTPQELARMRAIASALQKRKTPKNVGEGIAALGQGIASGLYMRQANKAEKAGQEGANSAFSTIMSALGGGGSEAASVPSGSGVSYSGNIPAEDLETDPVNRRISQGFSAFGGEDGSNYADAIASIESAGSGDYAAVGPQTGKGRAYGRYQVMDFNVGPWTEKHHGQRLTPEEFLASPEAQDAVFNGEFGSYVQKYGNPQDAASMWFTGKPAEQGANRADVNGMTGSRYVDKFTKALGTQTASLNPSIMPEEPAIDPKAVLAQRLTKMQGQGVSANPIAEEPQLAQAAPSQGVQRVAQAQQGMDQQTMQIIEAINNPYMQPGQKAVLGAMLKQRMQSNDPLHQMQLEKGQLELDQMRNPTTDDIKEYNLAKSQGYQGSFVDYMSGMKKAGAQNITVGGGKYGTIPPGFELVETPQGATLQAIPGGPAELEAQKLAETQRVAQETKARSGNVVIEDIDRALAGLDEGSLPTSGAFGGLLSNVPGTQAFDVGQLIETVKANSGFDRLQAMRDASPTGGALGAINQSEMGLLQAALGNLSQSQSADQLKFNLKRVRRVYDEIINGPGGGAASEGEGLVIPDVGQMTMEQLQGLDTSTMTREDLDAAEARFNELQRQQ